MRLKGTTKERKWFTAIWEHDIQTVKEMISEEESPKIINAQDKDGWTGLHLASLFKMEEITTLLLLSGADVNIQDSQGWSAFHEICIRGNEKIIKLAINSSTPNLNTKNKDGKTPMEELKKYNPKTYDNIMAWLAEEHPDKALEYMASDSQKDMGF